MDQIVDRGLDKWHYISFKNNYEESQSSNVSFRFSVSCIQSIYVNMQQRKSAPDPAPERKERLTARPFVSSLNSVFKRRVCVLGIREVVKSSNPGTVVPVHFRSVSSLSSPMHPGTTTATRRLSD